MQWQRLIRIAPREHINMYTYRSRDRQVRATGYGFSITISISLPIPPLMNKAAARIEPPRFVIILLSRGLEMKHHSHFGIICLI